MIKLAMLDIDTNLAAHELQTRMILQVHDELVFEAPRTEVDEVLSIVVRGMREALPLRVPVVVETAVGADWLEAH
jgi:DNA polymerase-1